MRHDVGSDWPAFVIEVLVVLGGLAVIYALLVFLPGR
jgi:hypothetical protein